MGFFRALLSLVLIVVIAGFAYWFIGAQVLDPSTPNWAQINEKMPDPLRRYGCREMRKRSGTAAVASCEGF
jgi:hypothetical protein